MLQDNDFALSLKKAREMGLENGTITIHIVRGEYHHTEYHIIEARKPIKKNVDGIRTS